jgi:O-antigen/teichoic acid export membrane protein
MRFAPAFWALADQCVVSASNFLTVFVLARHMATSAFGEFTIAQTGLLLVTGLQGALIVQPHNVLGARLADGAYRRFTAALLLAQLAGGLLVCSALAAVAFLLLHTVWPHGGSVLLVFALAALPWMAQELVRRVLYTRGESRAAFVNDLVTYGLQLAGAVVLVLALGEDARPETALAVLGGSSLLGALLGTWQIRDHFTLRGLDSAALRATLGEVWHFGKWLGAQNGLAWVGAQGHSWLVALMLGAEQVGMLRAVTHLANLLNPIRQAAFTYLPSRGSMAFHEGGRAGLQRWVQRMVLVLALALLPVCALLIAFPGQLLALAYGDRYASPALALLLAISAGGQFFTFVKYPFDIGILALGAPRLIFYLYAFPVFFMFTGGVAFIWWLGILGAPVTGTIINVVLLVTTVGAYLRLMRGTPDWPAAGARGASA